MRRSPRVAWASVGVGCFLTALALRSFALPQGREWSICFLRRFVGLPCPGCGLTRAFAALARGDLQGAVILHPLSPVFAAELLLAWLGWGVWAAAGRPVVDRRAVNVALLGNAAALLVVWFVRMATGTLPW